MKDRVIKACVNTSLDTLRRVHARSVMLKSKGGRRERNTGWLLIIGDTEMVVQGPCAAEALTRLAVGTLGGLYWPSEHTTWRVWMGVYRGKGVPTIMSIYALVRSPGAIAVHPQGCEAGYIATI